MAVGLGRQPAGVHQAVQANHQGLALDLELGLVEVVDDVLDRQPERVLGKDIEDEIFDIVGPSPRAATTSGCGGRRGSPRPRSSAATAGSGTTARDSRDEISVRSSAARSGDADFRPLRPMASMSAFCSSSCS